MRNLVSVAMQTVTAAMVLGAIAASGPARAVAAETTRVADAGPQAAPTTLFAREFATPPATSSAPLLMAQQTTTQTTPGQRPSSRRMRDTRSPTERVEARIKALHEQLHITDAQEAQWNDVARVMRDNAKSIEDLIKQRDQNIKTMNAMDDLRSYQALAEAHSEGLKKLVAAFGVLYDGMSDDQKKIADTVFRRSERRPPARAPAKKTN